MDAVPLNHTLPALVYPSLVVLSTLGVVGNGAIIAVTFIMRYMTHASNLLVAILAVCDFVTCLYVYTVSFALECLPSYDYFNSSFLSRRFRCSIYAMILACTFQRLA